MRAGRGIKVRRRGEARHQGADALQPAGLGPSDSRREAKEAGRGSRQVATSFVPARLTEKAVAVSLTSGPVPTTLTALSKGVFRIMLAHKLKTVPALLGLFAIIGFAGSLLLRADSPKLEPKTAPPTATSLLPKAGNIAPPAAPAPEPDVGAPVAYKDLMLVLVTKDGAAAVIFRDPVEDGVSYKFRYESADGKTKSVGDGKVLERRLNGGEGGFDETLLDIKAGPISLRWSKGNQDRGWIYYAPEVLQVHLAHADEFEDHNAVKFLADDRLYKALDLKRYMRK